MHSLSTIYVVALKCEGCYRRNVDIHCSPMSAKQLAIKKADEEQQIVYGEVYAPMIPDSDGDFMDAETIRKAAHNFLKNQLTDKVDTDHDNNTNGSIVVESFIARKDDPVFIEGSWVVGVHVPDADLWDQIKKGEINGFSMEALVHGEETELEIEIPDVIEGGTTEEDGHTHRFFVKFAENGDFLGGVTDQVNGHHHSINHGTHTGITDDHKHKFSFVEGFGDASYDES